MKLKKVAALCAKIGDFYLFDEMEEGGVFVRQWLGDGRSAYPLSGLPVLDESNLCAMLTITVQVDRPAGQAIGIKEQVAMALEHIGDVRVVSVTETHPEQLRIGGTDGTN